MFTSSGVNICLQVLYFMKVLRRSRSHDPGLLRSFMMLLQKEVICLEIGAKNWIAENEKRIKMYRLHVPALHSECNHYMLQEKT